MIFFIKPRGFTIKKGQYVFIPLNFSNKADSN